VWRETNFANAFSELRRSGQANAAEILARSTGGRRFRFLRRYAMESAVRAIGEEIHTQYLLTFTPPWRGTGKFHALDIIVRNHPDWKVRSRAGYWN